MEKVYGYFTSYRKNFGKKLQKVRRKKIIDGKRMTQKNLSDMFDVTEETVQSWEQGRSYPTIERVIQMAEFFECDYDYLLGDQEQPNKEYAHISEMTGLSYNAAECLAIMAAQKDSRLEILSALIESGRLLRCIDSAARATYQNGYLEQPGKERYFISAESMYNAERTAAFAELIDFIDEVRKESGLDPL